jgi:hypothetical protein
MSVMDWSDLDEEIAEGPRPGVHYETPQRTLAQRKEALEKANKIRTYRAQLKRDIKAGRENAPNVLLYPPEMVDTMKVFDLLVATPKRGHTKVNKLLVQCRISPSKTIGGMSVRQRTELVSMMGRR